MNPTLGQALAILNRIQPGLRAEILDNQPGQPKAQAYDTDRTTTGQGPADPTAIAANMGTYGWTKAGGKGKRNIIPRSPAARDLDTHDAAWNRILGDLCILAALSDRYLPLHEVPRAKLQALANQNTPGCHFMAQVDIWEPVHVTTDFGSVLNTPLPQPVPVGRWIYDTVRRYGQIPTKAQRTAHAKGKRINFKAAS